MADVSKQQRIEQADLMRRVRRARETNALWFYLLNALSLCQATADHVALLKGGTEDFYREYMDALLELRPATASRMAALETAFFAALNVVIEGWQDPGQQEPRLVDARIDALLQSEHAKTMRDYRNARWHPNALMEPRVTRLIESHKDLLPWAIELSMAFRRFFLDWRSQLPLEVADQM